MEYGFFDVPYQPQDQAEIPDIQWGVRVPLHRDHFSGKGEFEVFWVKRFDEGMFRTGEVKDIVPLDCLIEEGQAQGEDDGDDKQNLASQHVIVPGRRWRGALRAKGRKIFKAQ